MTRAEKIDEAIEASCRRRWEAEDHIFEEHHRRRTGFSERMLKDVPVGTWVYSSAGCAYGVVLRQGSLVRIQLPHGMLRDLGPTATALVKVPAADPEPCVCENCASVRERREFLAKFEALLLKKAARLTGRLHGH